MAAAGRVDDSLRRGLSAARFLHTFWRDTVSVFNSQNEEFVPTGFSDTVNFRSTPFSSQHFPFRWARHLRLKERFDFLDCESEVTVIRLMIITWQQDSVACRCDFPSEGGVTKQNSSLSFRLNDCLA